jgi:DNA-binding GntR family transcriptional regulator
MLAGRKDRADVAMSLRTRLAEPDADAPLHFHEFNTLVVELTESPTLVLLTTMLEHISSRATLNFVRHTGEGQNGPLARRAHRGRERLVALVAAGDAPGAEAHWRIHLTEAGERLVAGAGDSVLALFD